MMLIEQSEPELQELIDRSAAIVGRYHAALVEAKIPDDLAKDLVRVAHDVLWIAISNDQIALPIPSGAQDVHIKALPEAKKT